jgi:multifunctional methyltransferase subunit TRM112
MKLLTHNILTSKVIKKVTNGYPLKLVANKVEVKKSDFQPDFIKRMMQRVNYDVLFNAANIVRIYPLLFRLNLNFFNKKKQVNQAEGLPKPEEYKEDLLNDEDLVKRLHTALLEIEIIEGELICPETGRSFPIQNGIPNMLANEDEV